MKYPIRFLFLPLVLMTVAAGAQPEHAETAFNGILRHELSDPDRVHYSSSDGSFFKEYDAIEVSRADIDAFYRAVDDDAAQLSWLVRQDAGGVNNFVYQIGNSLCKTIIGGKAGESMLFVIFEAKEDDGWRQSFYALSWQPAGAGRCRARLVWGRMAPMKRPGGGSGVALPGNGQKPMKAIARLLAAKGAAVARSRYVSRRAGGLSFVEYVKFSLPVDEASETLLESVGGSLADTRPTAIRYSAWSGFQGGSCKFNVGFQGQPMGDGQLMVFPPSTGTNIWRTTVADGRQGTSLMNYNLLYAPARRPAGGKEYDGDDRYTGYILIDNDSGETFTIGVAPQPMPPGDPLSDIFSDREQLGDTLFDFRSSPATGMAAYRDKVERVRQSLYTYNRLYDDELKAINESFGKAIQTRKSHSTAMMADMRARYESRKAMLRKRFGSGKMAAEAYMRNLRRAADDYVHGLDSLSTSLQQAAGGDEEAYNRQLGELRKRYEGRLALMSDDGVPNAVVGELLEALVADYLSAPQGSILRRALSSKMLRLVRMETDNSLQPVYRQRQRATLQALSGSLPSDGSLREAFRLLE